MFRSLSLLAVVLLVSCGSAESPGPFASGGRDSGATAADAGSAGGRAGSSTGGASGSAGGAIGTGGDAPGAGGAPVASGGQLGAGGLIIGGAGGCWSVDDPVHNVFPAAGPWCEACEDDDDCARYARPHACISPGVNIGSRICRPTCTKREDCAPYDCIAAAGENCLAHACPTDVSSFVAGGGYFVCNGLQDRLCNPSPATGFFTCPIADMTE